MADIKFGNDQTIPEDGEHETPVSPHWTLIELLFFAYRDFTKDADEVLAQFGFGRAHHRVLHFVNRNPGLTVADLLDILKITKQSLARVLKQLVEDGFIEQRAGASDRRQRLLFTTQRGKALALELAARQSKRIQRALNEAGPDAQARFHDTLLAMVDVGERERVAALTTARREDGPRP
ncbi:MAG: MarR family transcriptional regulator [Rhodobiaceae bacterium]|nr:MarR family transcriptional regulator [Rhodobiaceae bacterium]MCC0056349.1 MarR family transcriptional regulator [Rhodobiaceae bacterium]